MHTRKPPININSDSLKIYDEFLQKDVVIVCGRNNSGKSYILKRLYKELGDKTSYLGPNRYQNFNMLGVVTGKRDKTQEYLNWLKNFQQNQQNIDNSPWNLQQAIAELGNERRAKLFGIMKDLLGSEIEIKMSDPNNDMSSKFVSVDGYNISYTSAGYRLIASILTSLLDTDYQNFLIDEPELGISPEIQGALSDFLLDSENRRRYFPHLKRIIIATHSPIFIDKNKISNNYYVYINNHSINIIPTEKVQQINALQFFLLGNRFETLFLPSMIILVEGKCDYKFISHLMKIQHSESNISVVQCNGDSRISEYINLAKNMFGDLNKSPYHNRIFVVLDKIHQIGMKDKLIKQGIPKENVIIWNKNGIEYYYPISVMNRIFGEYEKISIKDDIVSANGIQKKKNELVDIVIGLTNKSDKYNDEFNLKLLNKIENLIY